MTELEEAVVRAVECGLDAAALLDRDGNMLASAGDLDIHEPRAIAAFITHSLKGEALATRLFGGEIVPFELSGKHAMLGIAARSVFVIAIGQPETSNAARGLHDEVSRFITAMLELTAPPAEPPISGPPGSPSGPAQLPVIEFGVTPGVRRGKA